MLAPIMPRGAQAFLVASSPEAQADGDPENIFAALSVEFGPDPTLASLPVSAAQLPQIGHSFIVQHFIWPNDDSADEM